MSAITVLTLNAGSSSLKVGLHRVHDGVVETRFADSIDSADMEAAFDRVAKRLEGLTLPAPDAVGHRLVHGGPRLQSHALITDGIVQELEHAIAFAPLHTPAALQLLRAARTQFPAVPHIACLDTCFHAEMPDVARVLPIDRKLQDEGIRRYGFHGLSCESIVAQLGNPPPERLVIAHLGNGASITAVKSGRSVDTSMGMTPTGGVVMGTRSGDLDPGVLLYLIREKRFDAEMLEELLDHRSGLLGVSGMSSDMRVLRKAAVADRDARLAIDLFCMSIRKQIAAMAAVLGGIDTLVFTGGIGENDAGVRADVCEGLSWLGLWLDPVLNFAKPSAGDPGVAGVVQRAGSRCAIRVLRSDEDVCIARHAHAIVTAAA